MYSSPATIAALAPFILGLARGSAVRSFFPSVLLPNYPVPPPDLTFLSSQVGGPRELPRDVSLNLASPAMSLGGGVDCYPYGDAECYKKYWEEFSRCHPYDKSCYKDCNDYDEYTNHCKNYDPNYGKCYDRCHYDDDNCEKYEGCEKDDDLCYRKKKQEDTCHRDDDGCRQRHSYPPDFCKPWDWDCHKKQHGGEDYQCHPGSDKNCYPDYPDYPNYSDLEDDEPHQPQAHVQVVYAGEEGSFEQQVWPDGDEAWTGKPLTHVTSQDANQVFPTFSHCHRSQ